MPNKQLLSHRLSCSDWALLEGAWPALEGREKPWAWEPLETLCLREPGLVLMPPGVLKGAVLPAAFPRPDWQVKACIYPKAALHSETSTESTGPRTMPQPRHQLPGVWRAAGGAPSRRFLVCPSTWHANLLSGFSDVTKGATVNPAPPCRASFFELWLSVQVGWEWAERLIGYHSTETWA